MAPRQKRLLLAVDGSERAKLTVRYAGEEDAFSGLRGSQGYGVDCQLTDRCRFWVWGLGLVALSVEGRALSTNPCMEDKRGH